VFLYLLRIVGVVSLVFVIALIVSQKWWYKQIIRRSVSSRFFWKIFCPALTTGLIICIVPVLLGTSDSDEFFFTDFNEFLAYTGFCTFLITGGVLIYWKHWAKEETEKERAKNEVKNKDDAKDHFELATNYIIQGDKESAMREYQIIEHLDKELAGELYDRIFSECT